MDMAIELTRARTGVEWSIGDADQEAVVVEVGGGLRAYRAGDWEIVDGYADTEICPGSAGQMLAPWPNRIRDGRFSFGGQIHQLSLTEPVRHNAIHGLVCWSRWRATESTATSVTVEHDLIAQPGYPWPVRLRTVWSVGPDGLRADHEATNVGDEACPFGFGPHPYLAIPGTPVDEFSLRLPAASRLLTDGRGLPIGAARVAGSEYDFNLARRIGSTVLDTTYGDPEPGPGGVTTVSVTGPDGHLVEVWADASFGWWQVFTGDTLDVPRYRRSVAIEPMTCPPDAFRSGRDVVVLEPGATWCGSWGIRGRRP